MNEEYKEVIRWLEARIEDYEKDIAAAKYDIDFNSRKVEGLKEVLKVLKENWK